MRLFLCWRWWRRDDLASLLRTSLEYGPDCQLQCTPAMAASAPAVEDPDMPALERPMGHLPAEHRSTAAGSPRYMSELCGFPRFHAAALGQYDAPEHVLLPRLQHSVLQLLNQAQPPEPGAGSGGAEPAAPACSAPAASSCPAPSGPHSPAAGGKQLAVLDYGAGQAKLLAYLDHHLPPDVALVGCDPFVPQPKHWDAAASVAGGRRVAVWTTHCAHAASGAAMQLQAGGAGGAGSADGAAQYSVVVCSLVLCTLPDEAQYRTALAHVCGATAPGGHLLIALCNPYMTHHGDTAMQRRITHGSGSAQASAAAHASTGGHALPGSYWQKEVWRKALPGAAAVDSAGGVGVAQRVDVHRPLEALAARLAQHGMQLIRQASKQGQ